jgi:hypothetical protein
MHRRLWQMRYSLPGGVPYMPSHMIRAGRVGVRSQKGIETFRALGTRRQPLPEGSGSARRSISPT